MAQSPNSNNYPARFITVGLVLLSSALLFGLLAALQYITPGWGRDQFSFAKIRPLHVSSAVFWIIIGAMGAVLAFFREHNEKELKNKNLIKLQFYLFTAASGAILISYFFGIFSGREYWEFHPLFAIPIAIGWILFIINFTTNHLKLKGAPVYVWMWFTGAVFFLFTYLESNLWLIPGVRNHLVKDMTIQWKSYGAMVGAWNQLIYGSSIYLMDKIAGNKKYSHSPMAFGLYFLGLFNLMFNWGHHIYTLPAHAAIQYIAYIVSMTELFIFGRIIYTWRSSVDFARKNIHKRSYQLLVSADIWVFLTLGLAIAMSVPVLNLYMHGTHVIVGHTMGATIGINSFLLLAFAYDIIGSSGKVMAKNKKLIDRGIILANVSLFVFWITLIIAGFLKAFWQMSDTTEPFGAMMVRLQPWFTTFYIAGVGLATGFTMIIYPLLRKQWVNRFGNTDYTKSATYTNLVTEDASEEYQA
ncbi:MAG: cbb3-type cytochrome c oxidase subunit I [Chitinophagaceae bacterium]|nr:cbb3-type cytochrome c oxidase subunit I [Chitinophagaceae bacterium]